MANYNSYEKRPDNDLVVGTTNAGEKVGFENMDQLNQAGGAGKVQVNPNLNTADVIPFSQFQVKASSTIPADAVANPITKGDVDALLKENDKNYQSLLSSLEPTEAEKASKARLLALQQNQQERVEKVQERPLDGTVLRAGVDREISNISSGNTRESLVNLREQTFEAQNLANLQKDREIALQKLSLAYQNGQFNTTLAKQFNDLIRAEQQEAKKLAMEYGIKSNYYLSGGTVYRTSDGKPFSREGDFFKDAGVSSFDEARRKGLLSDLGPSIAQRMQQEQIDIQRQNAEVDRMYKIKTLENQAKELELKYGGLKFDFSNIPTGQMETVNGLMDAFNAVAVGLTDEQRKSAKTSFQGLVNRGDIEGAKEYLISTIAQSNAVPADQKNKVYGRQEALNALTDVKKLLKEYEAAGGDTGFFTGKMEDWANKIGKTTDPKLATIQNQIRLALVDYRRAVSGAAFTETEAAEYNRLFPSVGKVSEFNSAIIDSLAQTFSRNQKSFLQVIVGPTAAESLLSAPSPFNSDLSAKIEEAVGAGYKPEEILDQVAKTSAELNQMIQTAKGQGYGPEEILNYLKTNSGAGSTTQKTSYSPELNSDANKIAAAIKQVESGGRYDAKGGSGEFGAYQFMPATWKGWANKYLGNANAPMTPENQDKVALAKIQDLMNQGYNAQQIALIWNGGSPTIKSGTNKFGVKYDTGAYANKVLAALKNLG